MSDTTEDLIRLVKEKETIPDSGAAYSDSTLLRYLDQALKAFIIPAVEATLEEHFVVTHDVQVPAMPNYPAGTPPVGVQNTIEIPGESTGLRLRDIYVVGSDGSFFNLPRLTPTQAASQGWGAANQAIPGVLNQTMGGFYLQGNTVQVFPYSLASDKILRITYQRAPGDLCLTSSAGRVVSVTGDVVQIDRVQTSWFGGITRVAVVSGLSPYDYVADPRVQTRVYTSPEPLNNITLVNVSGNVLTLPAGVGAAVQVGDWICPANNSVFAQNIPRELLPAMVQKAAEMCIHAAGDAGGTQMARAEFADMLSMALKMIAPRVIGKPVKVLPVNSAFRASRGSNYRSY